MLVEGFGEDVPARAVSHEIKVAGARRIGRRLQCGAARIGDRPRRQPGDDISIVWRRLLDFAAHDGPSEGALPPDKAIDDRGIRLKLHLLLEPVDEHRGDPAALVGAARLLFDDRRQHDQLVRGLQRQIRRASFPHLLNGAPLRLLHASDHLLARGATGEPIGLRQQGSLLGDLLHGPAAAVAFAHAREDLLRREALRQGDLVLDLLALDQGVDHVAQARLTLELVLAIFELVARPERDHAALEDPGLVDDTLALEEVGDVADTEATRDVNDTVGLERTGRLEAVLAGGDRRAPEDGREDDDRQDRIADDDDRVTGPPGGPPRLRKAFGLERGARAAWSHTRGARIPTLVTRLRRSAQRVASPAMPDRGLDWFT